MRKTGPLAALLVLAALPARGDPRFVWQTIDTPHFEVTYHQGELLLAQKIARMAEESHRRLVPLLEHEPSERTQIVVTDDTDYANGSATPLLYNVIRAYAPPPDPHSSLADFDDYVFELISHEYTHILHLDTVSGLPKATNDIFGKLWIPNGGQPAWFIEGMAVFAESELSGSGRVRSSQDEMAVRAEVLEDTFPGIDELSNSSLRWPRGFSWYTLGGRFITWIGDEYGLGALRDASHDFGGRAIPLGMNISARHVLGQSYLQLYEQFRAWEADRAHEVQRAVQAEGETPVEVLTHLGENLRSPRWSRDGGTLYYAHAGADRLAELRALEPGPCCALDARVTTADRPGDRHVVDMYSDGYGDNSLALDAEGRIVYARKQVYQQFEVLQDLYAFDPRSGGGERLSRGLRAREPDVAHDGSVAFVWRRPGGGTAIAELAPGAAEPRILFEDPSGGPVGSPRYSPDGATVAFVHHRDGAWDVRLIGRDGGAVQDVTHDRALDRDPAWSPDGRYLLFSSDRTGVYDVYAYRLADGALLRVTNVVLGAFDPEVSPDGSQLALTTYSSRGYDLARMPYDPSSWTLVTAPAVADAGRPAVAELPPLDLFPVRDYDPLPTLRPHFWIPFAAADALGTTVGVLTAGFDVAGRHDYTAEAWWAIDSKQPGFSLTYGNHTLYPDLSFSATRDVQTAPGGGAYYTERALTGSATASFAFDQVERGHSLELEYQLINLAANTNPQRVRIGQGHISSALVSYVYSDSKRFLRSISPEQGQRFAVTVRVSDPALGSDFKFQQLATSFARYLALPWQREGRPLHHVLALRGAFGMAHGDFSERHLYGLGGFDQGDPLRSVLSPASAPVRILRGFRDQAFVGDLYALGTLEYRFPLLEIEKGAWTLPFYLRRLHAAVFADAGDAWHGRYSYEDRFKLHAGAGAELRAEVVLGYVLPADVRFGCARGLEKSDLAILDCYAAIGGVF